MPMVLEMNSISPRYADFIWRQGASLSLCPGDRQFHIAHELVIAAGDRGRRRIPHRQRSSPRSSMSRATRFVSADQETFSASLALLRSRPRSASVVALGDLKPRGHWTRSPRRPTPRPVAWSPAERLDVSNRDGGTIHAVVAATPARDSYGQDLDGDGFHRGPVGESDSRPIADAGPTRSRTSRGSEIEAQMTAHRSTWGAR